MTPETAGRGPNDPEGRDQAAGGAAPPAEALAEAVGHLQTAALSVVAALRAALDAAEQLAKDPGPLLGLLAEAARGASGSSTAPEPPQRPRVEHIAVIPQQEATGDDRSVGGVSRTRARTDDEAVESRDHE